MKSWENRAQQSLRKEIEQRVQELTRMLDLYPDAAEKIDPTIWKKLLENIPGPVSVQKATEVKTVATTRDKPE